MLSQAVGYAATALGCIAAQAGEPVLIKTVARRTHVPRAFLAKIINQLARKRLVHTRRGQGGGVTLARAPSEITLYDLCLIFDDPVVEHRCMWGSGRCQGNPACPAHDFCRNCRTQQIGFLRGVTIADLAEFDRRKRQQQSNPTTADDASATG